jgi:hypothetical protein
MMIKIRAKSDFVSGFLFVAIGLGFALVSRNYELGTAGEMGPGYFPFGLGVLLSGLGLMIVISAVVPSSEEQALPKLHFKVALFILGPVILFALLLDTLGFVLSLFVVALGSSFACHELRWHTAFVSAVVLITTSVVVFVLLLKVQVQLWPTL